MRKETHKMDVFIQHGVVAGLQVMQESGLMVTEENADRIGANISSGISSLGLTEENHSALMNGGLCKISLFFVPSIIVNMVAGHLFIMYDLRGRILTLPPPVVPLAYIIIDYVARIIAYDDADVMLDAIDVNTLCDRV